MFWILNYCAVFWLILTIVFIWLYKQYSYDYWLRLNIKSFKPIPFFGNTFDVIIRRKRFHETVDDLYKSLGDEPFGGIYHMHHPYLLIKDPRLVSSILVSDFRFSSTRGPFLFFNAGNLSSSVGLATGERWKMLRRKMSSAFSSYRLNQMYREVIFVVAELIEFVNKRMDTTESVDIDIMNLANNFTTEVVGLCFFGVFFHCFEKDKNDVVEMCDPLFTAQTSDILRLAFSTISKRFQRKFKLPDPNKKARDFFRDMVLDVVDHRRRNKETRKDLMQLVMSMQNSHKDPKFAVTNDVEHVSQNDQFNEMDIVANMFFVHIAASESTAATLSFCLYELALNENIQEKLRTEIQQVLDESVELNFSSLRQMVYLEAVIAETLRKYPPGPSLTRQCVEDYVIPGTNIRVPAGTKTLIPVWSIHHDCRYYPNPEVFDPERFTGDKKYELRSGQYLPFGDGPRACFGKTFAEMELKAVISTIILKYNIKPCDKTEIPVKLAKGSLTLHNSDGIWVNFIKRKIETPF